MYNCECPRHFLRKEHTVLEFAFNDATDTVSADERARAEFDPMLRDGQGYVVAQYLHLDFTSVLGNEMEGGKFQRVTETDDPVWVTIEIPEEFKNTDPEITRSYGLLNMAGGTTLYLGDLDTNDDTLTVALNKYGLCALLMKDKYTDGNSRGSYWDENGFYRGSDGRITSCSWFAEDGENIIRLDEFGRIAHGWHRADIVTDVWTYLDPVTGYKAKPGWKYIDDAWYHFQNSGFMEEGWIVDETGWKTYYLDSNGRMAHSQWIQAEADNDLGMPAGIYHLTADGAVQMNGWAESPTPGVYWYLRAGDGLFEADNPACWSSVNPEA